MSQTMVVKSFADLPRLLNLDELPPAPTDAVGDEEPDVRHPGSAGADDTEAGAAVDLLELLAELEAASASLAAAARQD